MENACFDIPDERDWQYEVLMWSQDFLEINWPDIEVFNQWLKPVTRMSCTRVWLWHIINAQRKVNWITPIDIEAFWLRYLKVNPNAEKDWASLQGALQQAKDVWLIESLFVVWNKTEMHDAISKWLFIYSGSANWDWAFVRREKKYRLRTDGKFVWHAFCFPKKWVLLNSYWAENWYIEFPEELYNTTYTKYAIVPKVWYNLDLLYKKRIMENIKLESAKKAFENWFWNWLEWDKPVSREEAGAMMQRVYDKLSAELKKE